MIQAFYLHTTPHGLTGHCLRLPTTNLVGFWVSGARFLGGLVPLLFSHPNSLWSHPEARNCSLQPAQGTVLLLFHFSIGSEYSPRARQTCSVCCQDPLSWFLASPTQTSIHTTEVRQSCREVVSAFPLGPPRLANVIFCSQF